MAIGKLAPRSRKMFMIKESQPEDSKYLEHGWSFTIFVYDRWLQVELPNSVISFVDYKNGVIHLYEDGIGPILYEASKEVPR